TLGCHGEVRAQGFAERDEPMCPDRDAQEPVAKVLPILAKVTVPPTTSWPGGSAGVYARVHEKAQGDREAVGGRMG
ncbi:MAG: hypothetical protein KC492_36825, partial [Myxococcales bacterium]|nr:hypothetical protein [Myxococcales bacterium]